MTDPPPSPPPPQSDRLRQLQARASGALAGLASVMGSDAAPLASTAGEDGPSYFTPAAPHDGESIRPFCCLFSCLIVNFPGGVALELLDGGGGGFRGRVGALVGLVWAFGSASALSETSSLQPRLFLRVGCTSTAATSSVRRRQHLYGSVVVLDTSAVLLRQRRLPRDVDCTSTAATSCLSCRLHLYSSDVSLAMSLKSLSPPGGGLPGVSRPACLLDPSEGGDPEVWWG